jgi:hypothetical protein
MNDWIGLGVIGFLILCGLAGLWGLSRPYDVSVDEFERRAKEGPGAIGAGFAALQKVLDPSAEKAVEVQQDLKRGRYNRKQGSGDPPEPGAEARENDNPEGDITDA